MVDNCPLPGAAVAFEFTGRSQRIRKVIASRGQLPTGRLDPLPLNIV
jgi:hypothetical protein